MTASKRSKRKSGSDESLYVDSSVDSSSRVLSSVSRGSPSTRIHGEGSSASLISQPDNVVVASLDTCSQDTTADTRDQDTIKYTLRSFEGVYDSWNALEVAFEQTTLSGLRILSPTVTVFGATIQPEPFALQFCLMKV
ncbi:hypothetical protein PHMEG_0005926 [Phytophthora megakarya]|uniref:Uncharacterized protein n=1 Tax=Phytophthora megakarya TaxID=4795 RepID=A0A225WRV2_9STRA|nr:hypothetical protein PHMEG_0005926 [Phytophthora megakarya]